MKKAGKDSFKKQKKPQVSKKDSEDEDEDAVEVSNIVKIMNVDWSTYINTEGWWRTEDRVPAEKIFANHVIYGEAFNNTTTSAEKSAWTMKIKNRLKVLTKQTHEHIKEMGETGAGIQSAEDIYKGTELTKTWGA
ncbi:hypothetical protein L208DRAFT_1376813 [Tricholoma matsutake]|nr:hypothetical protein L208DRAFT_1376813 [Tricholoma matsutake 945]